MQRNATPAPARVRVLRGVKNLMDIGKVVEVNGQPKQSVWNDTKCDTYQGTDGTIFHPWIYEDEDIVSFSPDICRSLPAYYEKKTKYAGKFPKEFS